MPALCSSRARSIHVRRLYGGRIRRLRVVRELQGRGRLADSGRDVSRWCTNVTCVDDRAFFEVEGAVPTVEQLAFLSELRVRLSDGLRPYCSNIDDTLLLILDVDAPDVALVSVGLELRGSTLRGDRISVHDLTFPSAPTRAGFEIMGPPNVLADRGRDLFDSQQHFPSFQ